MYNRIVFTILVFLSSCVLPAHAGAVQCACPQISAKGTGDTSCSATETGGECTVDFNTFARQDEQAAFRVLNSSTRQSLRFPDLAVKYGSKTLTSDLARFIAEDQPELLMDVLLLYVLVSALQTNSFTVPVDLGWLLSAMYSDRNSIAFHFSFPGSKKRRISARNLSAEISYGCIEVRSSTGEYWGMYKAFWSDSASKQQCK